MKTQLIIMGLLFTYVSLQCNTDATIYKCADSSFQENQCMVMDTDVFKENNNFKTRTVYRLRKCAKSQKCKSITENGLTVGVCVDKDAFIKQFDGEKCSYNEECYSQTCNDSRCVGVKNGDVCPGPYSCQKYSACYREGTYLPYYCTPIVSPNSDCVSDSLCPFGYVCGKNSASQPKSKCLKMFSVEIGNYAFNDLLCKTGKVQSYGNGLSSLCSSSSMTKVEPCLLDNDCEITYTNGIINSTPYKHQTCSWNGKDAYAKISTEDDAWKNYIQIYSDIIKNTNIDDIKNIEYARKNYYGSRKLNDAYLTTFYFAEMKGADACAINFFLKSTFTKVSFLSLLTLAIVL